MLTGGTGRETFVFKTLTGEGRAAEPHLAVVALAQDAAALQNPGDERG